MNSKELADLLGVTVQAVNLARKQGRITPLRKEGREYIYDPDRAIEEYQNNTLQPKASRAAELEDPDGEFDHGEDDDHGEPDVDENGYYTDRNGKRKRLKSVLDIPKKFWTTHQAQNARAIFDAELKQLELDREAKKYYPTKEVETVMLQIATEFSRALVGLPVKLKQKIDKLDPRDLKAIEEVCSEIIANCESNISKLRSGS